MNSYHDFSHFYDQVMGDRTDVINIVLNCIDQHHQSAESLLELGCGTGSILEGLTDRFKVEGLDISPEMLKIAQLKLPGIRLHQADITDFSLEKQYDVAICVFDTINHLLKLQQWTEAFRTTAAHLNSGGLFLFDTLTTGRLRAETVMPTYTEEFTSGTLEITTTSVNRAEVSNAITFQEPQLDGLVQVYEQELHEAAFPLSAVTGALEPYFEVIDTFTSDTTPPSDRAGRVYYVCRKR